ncbi:hypothetical protein F5884DRAFT_730209 [Xylogone sp. PMI_703]|nr:hypothetical protein F5884DRAFT_730209 [Xylogone sp. PMI_703]
MADQNSYVRYKRETRHLLYWMIHASNTILKSSRSLPVADGIAISVNTTGEIPVSAVVPIANLIANYIKPIPPTIYRIFQCVIAARTAAHKVFKQISASNPNPEIERSNVSHKQFIDTLREAFEVLGGKSWEQEQKAEAKKAYESDDDVIFANRFSLLRLDKKGGESEQEDDEETVEDAAGKASSSRRKETTRTGKKYKGAKKGRKRKLQVPVREENLEDVPLESYRILEDKTETNIEYLMAISSLIEQWIELRDYTQIIWRHVAYDGLNSAVAGCMSNVSIAMVKQVELAIFAEFPGYDSYGTLIDTITGGDIDKAQGMSDMLAYQMDQRSQDLEAIKAPEVDVREQLMVHTYENLLDFVTDFQKTRSGKPTKSMLSGIRNWDPYFDLEKATKEERLKWRRSYTINWLFDLINLYSSVAIQCSAVRRETLILEDVDWSINGPWSEHRRLFGLTEFAGVITTLAMQKPGTDIRKRILPHHVFQLQYIVDSFAISRGWAVTSYNNHLVFAPASEFHPTRDIDLFVDRKSKRTGSGYTEGISAFHALLMKDATTYNDPRGKRDAELVKSVLEDFVDWLGESWYMHDVAGFPVSRFSATNVNGLWEYSPFLCGVGLTEALEISHDLNFYMWGIAFLAINLNACSVNALHATRIIRRSTVSPKGEWRTCLNPKTNQFFKQKSLLRVYSEAGWMLDRIPDEDIFEMSLLCLVRLSQTKVITDPETGKRVLENTKLISRSKAAGMWKDQIDGMSSELDALVERRYVFEPKAIDEILGPVPEGLENMIPKFMSDRKKQMYTGMELLAMIQVDFYNNICGETQLLALNSAWVTSRFLMLFQEIEQELCRLRNPLWVRAYEKGPREIRLKRGLLTVMMLNEQEPECMEVLARLFIKHAAEFSLVLGDGYRQKSR